MTAPSDPIRFEARLERHQPDLPIYLMVPPAVPARFDRTRTFVVETIVNGKPIGRRSIKPWGDGRWFMELTKPHCQRLAIGVGDGVVVEVAPARALPPELEERIRALGLQDRWHRHTEAQRRALAEQVFAARTAATRTKRIEHVLATLRRDD